MRIESSVRSISWIPSGAVPGMTRLPFDMGMGHHDDAPPDHIDDLEALGEADRFRFQRVARVARCRRQRTITGHGYSGAGQVGSTTLRLGGKVATFAAAPLAWTTLPLTLYADGSSAHDVVGASPFPRLWPDWTAAGPAWSAVEIGVSSRLDDIFEPSRIQN